MSWLPPSDGWLSITDTVALSYEIGWLRHRRIFSNDIAASTKMDLASFKMQIHFRRPYHGQSQRNPAAQKSGAYAP